MTDRYEEQNKASTMMYWTEDNCLQAYVSENEGMGIGS